MITVLILLESTQLIFNVNLLQYALIHGCFMVLYQLIVSEILSNIFIYIIALIISLFVSLLEILYLVMDMNNYQNYLG